MKLYEFLSTILLPACRICIMLDTTGLSIGIDLIVSCPPKRRSELQRVVWCAYLEYLIKRKMWNCLSQRQIFNDSHCTEVPLLLLMTLQTEPIYHPPDLF